MRAALSTAIESFSKFINQHRFKVLLIICLYALVARFYGLIHEQIFFYDEGMYLGRFQQIQQLFEQMPNRSFSDYSGYLQAIWSNCLKDAKPLWFLIANLSVFFPIDHLHFLQLISILSSTLAVIVLYFLAKEFQFSKNEALATSFLLSLFPSHIFYGQLSMQEAFSALWMLLGFLFIVKGLKHPLFFLLTGVCFSLAFLTNYRLIILATLMVCIPIVQLAIDQKWKKILFMIIWLILPIMAIVLPILFAQEGSNFKATFGWMGQQQEIASSSFHFSSLLFFPYTLLRFDSLMLLVLLLATPFVINFKSSRHKSIFCVLVMIFIYMFIFSLTGQKGMRFIHVLFPFMILTGVSLLSHLYQKKQILLTILISLMLIGEFIWHQREVFTAQQNYSQVTTFLNQQPPDAKTAFGAQWKIYRLTQENSSIGSIANTLPQYIQRSVQQRSRWLILDPQIYIDKVKDPQKLLPYDYLTVVKKIVKPTKVIDHFNDYAFDRFILEHTYHLPTTLNFIRQGKQLGWNKIYIYDNFTTLQKLQKLQ